MDNKNNNKNNLNFKSKKTFLNLNTQNKFIIIGWIVSSLIIFLTAWFIINNSQKKMYETYHNFGLITAKTLAVESQHITSNTQEKEKIIKLKALSQSLIQDNNDISYIVFKDQNNQIIYSSKVNSIEEKTNPQKVIKLSTPVTKWDNGQKTIIGSVHLGLTGHTMRIMGKTTKTSMILIFAVAWLLSMVAVIINTLLVTRQISLLLDGVKRITTGDFGFKVSSNDLWGEIKQLFEAFNNMSVKLRQYEDKNIDKLTYERNKFEAVLMSIANGVVVCDNNDNVILVNNASLKMLNMKAKDILNTKISNYCDINGEMCFHDLIDKFKNTPLEEMEAKPIELQSNIEDKVVSVIISPIYTFSKDYLGYIIILHDVTRETEIDKMKSQFISNVSHELRTPVTIIRSYIDTLFNYGNEFDDDTKQEFLNILNQESDRLNKMVNDILDFSRLESPNISLEKDLCQLGPIIELTVRSMKVLAEDKNLVFSIMIEPDLPQVSINTESIERVLKNLLSNAIKYSNDGGRIKVKAEVDRTGNYLEISVTDNGLGIEKKHLEKIFDRFYRVENSTHTIKGTGLGLHLVKINIEKHHNGKVFAESKPGEGSTFGFKLPLSEAESHTESNKATPLNN